MLLASRFRSPLIAAVVATALGAGFIIWNSMSPSDAVATDPTLAVADSGTTAGAEQATLFDTTNTAPISMIGQTDSTVTTTWLPTEAALNSTSDIVYPEGWSLQYTTDGSSWSSSAPGALSTVRGIRAAGDVSSFGLDASGYQVSANQSAGQLAAPVSFPPTPGGDGYSLTFTPTRALNVWHHQGSTITIECHDRFTGLGCGTADSQLKYQIAGYGNTNNSLGAYNNATGKFYTGVHNATNDSVGFLCVDYTGAAPVNCATSYIQMSGSGMGTTRNDLGATAFEGTAYNATKFYLVDAENDRLHCLDMTTGVRCANFTVDGFPIANHGDGIEGNWVSDISVIGGKVYYFAGPYFGCVDTSTNPPSNCDSSKPLSTITNKALTSNVAELTTSAAHGFIAGDSVLVAGVDNTFNGVYTVAAAGTTTFTYTKTATNVASTAVTNAASVSKNPTIALASDYQFPPIPIYNTSGVLQMVCSVTGRECMTSTGASATFPSTFGTWLTSMRVTTANMPTAYTQASVGEWTILDQKFYMPADPDNDKGGFWADDAICWDFAANTYCPGGTNGAEYDVSTPGTLYAFVADPDEPCIWTVSDSDGIGQFGSNLVTCYPDSSVLFKYNETVPRMSCNEAGRVRLWQVMNITWTAGTLSASDIRVTIKNTDTGLNVPGWIQVPVVAGAGNTATLDLTSLAVSASGTKPTFRVIGLGKIASDLAGLTSEIKYASDPPQVCLKLKPIACDIGLVGGVRYPLMDFTVTTAFVAAGAASSSQTKTAVGTGGSMLSASCATGALQGSSTRDWDTPVHGTVQPNAPVRLLHPRTGAVIAETVTDANGNYSFPSVIAGTYDVEFGIAETKGPNGQWMQRWLPAVGKRSAVVPAGGVGRSDTPYRPQSNNGCFGNGAQNECGGGGAPAEDPGPLGVVGSTPVEPAPERVTDSSEGSKGTGDMPVPAPLPANLDDMRVKPQERVIGPTGGVVTPVPQSIASKGGKVQAGSLVIWTGASWVKTFTDPNVGTWTVVGDEVQFVPMPGYVGDTTIWYRLTDSKGQSAMSTVTMKIRSAALPKCSLPGAKQVAVTFDVYKYAVSQADRSRIKKVTRPGCSYVVVGFVQPDDQLSNDYSLSLNRAKAVAAQIRALEPTARITIVAGKRQIKQICDKADNRCVVVSLANKKKA